MTNDSPAFLNFAINLFKNSKIRSIQDVGSIDIVDVSSTAISEVRYDIVTQTLTIQFLESGSEYNYYNCSESQYESLVNSMSVGQTFNQEIKGNYFYSRV